MSVCLCVCVLSLRMWSGQSELGVTIQQRMLPPSLLPPGWSDIDWAEMQAGATGAACSQITGTLVTD